jgi:hypothetical protein
MAQSKGDGMDRQCERLEGNHRRCLTRDEAVAWQKIARRYRFGVPALDGESAPLLLRPTASVERPSVELPVLPHPVGRPEVAPE